MPSHVTHTTQRDKGRMDTLAVYRLILSYSQFLSRRDLIEVSELVAWFVEGNAIDGRGPLAPIPDAEFRRFTAGRSGAARELLDQLFLRSSTGSRYIAWPRGIGRSGIPSKLRRFVLERDGRRCRYCGATTRLQIDHIKPWSRGGTHDPENLQVLCGPCNIRKGPRA